MTSKYEDIINLPHPTSKKHSRMSMHDRAAQFAPFAALVGYSDAVKETARITNKRIELDEDEKDILNRKLQIVKSEFKNYPKINILYFIPDNKKQGGKYVELIGIIRRIDEYKHKFIMEDKTQIPIDEILDVTGDIFCMYEE